MPCWRLSAAGTSVISRDCVVPVLQPIEEEVYLVLSMLLDIEMEGFVDLFHQLYSWHECSVVEATLRKIDLHNLADLFTEAKLIFSNGKRNLTEEEYQAIDPFGNDERWQRFDTIGKQMLVEGSEIYLIGERICSYVQAHINAFADL
jgi:hypothetical protein